jgi:hypothetical protein
MKRRGRGRRGRRRRNRKRGRRRIKQFVDSPRPP